MSNVNKIIIRATNWIGDAILNLPAIHQLRRMFPDAEITVFARPWVSDIFKYNPDINKIISFNEKKNTLDYLKLIFQLRKENYDLAVLFPNAFNAGFFAFAIGAKKRIGYNTDKRGIFLTDKIEQTSTILKVHQVEYYMNIIKQFGETDKERVFNIVVTDDEKNHIRKRLLEFGIVSETFLIGINPGAYYGSAKRWYPDRFAQVIDYLYEKHNARFVLTGSEKDKSIASEILKYIKIVEPLREKIILDWVGKTTLRELIALISCMRAFITNDSGAMHIAAALNIPMIAIFGSTDWVTTAPYSKNHIIVRKDTPCAPCLLRECPEDHKCMKNIYVEDVIDAFEKLIKEHRVLS